jgi:hypothetical protein
MTSFSKHAFNISASMHGNLVAEATVFFHSIYPSVGIPASDLRHRVVSICETAKKYMEDLDLSVMEDIGATVIWSVYVAIMSKAMQELLPHKTLFRGTF